MKQKIIVLAALTCLIVACKDRPGMGAATGTDTINKSQEAKNTGDSSVAFAGKLDTMGVLFLQREWAALKFDSSMAAAAVERTGEPAAQQYADKWLQSYPERRRQLLGIAYQLNVMLNDSTRQFAVGRAGTGGQGMFSGDYLARLKARLQNTDTAYQTAMKNDNHLLRDFAARLQKRSRQELDSLNTLYKKGR